MPMPRIGTDSRDAADVHARAAEALTFDDRGLATGLGEPGCQRGASLSGPDHEGVVVDGHVVSGYRIMSGGYRV